MQRKMIVLAASVLLGSMLAGCTANNDGVRPKNVNDANRITNRDNGMMRGMNRADNAADFPNMTMDEKLANKIAKMKEVRNAYVLLTNNNAYVGVSLENNTRGGRMPNGAANNGYTGTGLTDPTGITGPAGLTGRGDMTGPLGTRGAADRTGIAGTTGTTNMTGRTGMTGRAGMFGANDNNLNDELKAKIAKNVQKAAPNVKNVYISANPDFVGRMTNYWDEVRAGNPIQGFASEFGEMVNRLFPANAASRPAGTR